MNDTIFALSSGAPPAGLAVIRISGPQADSALQVLAGRVPAPRKASLTHLRGQDGKVLDESVILWFPGPGSATGEDCAELHLHGGRAVVAAVEAALARIEGFRRAEPGEFTRRAFANGRMNLTEAEGLADLLNAETELQRMNAMALADGALSRCVSDWRDRILHLSARIEAALDFSDEDDVDALPAGFGGALSDLASELADWLQRPRAERLQEGLRIVIAGPPNAGKSTLFNALVESEAAITSPVAGTTRDVIERSVALSGVALTLVDTAGLHEGAGDSIERIGIGRAEREVERADLVLWLGPEGEGPPQAIEVDARCDDGSGVRKDSPDLQVSALTGQGMDELRAVLVDRACKTLPKPGEIALNRRQAGLVAEAHEALQSCVAERDLLLAAEGLRQARAAFDRLIGRASTEDMLDALFGRFCIGK